jgi:hypothetical protein
MKADGSLYSFYGYISLLYGAALDFGVLLGFNARLGVKHKDYA